MEKTLLGPGPADIEDSDLDHMVHSVGVATEHEGHVRVVFSGVVWPEGDVEEQTRNVLEFLGRALADVGGTLDDVVVLRWYVLDDYLSRETQARIHEVRSEFFEPPHYPASTMVGVSSLLDDDEGHAFELEAEAEVPADDWTTNAFVGEDHEEVPGETVREMLSEGGDESGEQGSNGGTEPTGEDA